MAHPRVEQLRFARSEFMRGLDGVSDEDARRRLVPMNCISWMVGHMAWHEHACWMEGAQGKILLPHLGGLVGYGRPASAPLFQEMLEAWRAVTAAADRLLDTLTTKMLSTHYEWRGKLVEEDVGTLLQRVTYHYWYHIGESQAVRQLLDHANLPEYVGDIGAEAPYCAE